MQFTVYFESPFWVGILEVERNGVLYAARHVFGAEPSNQVIYEFVRDELGVLCARLTVGVAVERDHSRRKNPKRVQREIRRELTQAGTTTKAHAAMRQQIEQHKRVKRALSKAEQAAERARRRAFKRAKAKKRHRGR